MNRLLHYFFFVFCVFLLAEKGFSSEMADKILHKTYLPVNNIVLHQGNILVACEGNWIRVPNLSSDEGGFYVASNDPWYAPWTCSCGQVNMPYHVICQRCHRSR